MAIKKNNICIICGEDLHDGRHLRKHNLNMDQYLRLYTTDSEGNCPNCGKPLKYMNGALRNCKCKVRLHHYLFTVSSHSRTCICRSFRGYMELSAYATALKGDLRFYYIRSIDNNIPSSLGMVKVKGDCVWYASPYSFEFIKDLNKLVVTNYYIHESKLMDQLVVTPKYTEDAYLIRTDEYTLIEHLTMYNFVVHKSPDGEFLFAVSTNLTSDLNNLLSAFP